MAEILPTDALTQDEILWLETVYFSLKNQKATDRKSIKVELIDRVSMRFDSSTIDRRLLTKNNFITLLGTAVVNPQSYLLSQANKVIKFISNYLITNPVATLIGSDFLAEQTGINKVRVEKILEDLPFTGFYHSSGISAGRKGWSAIRIEEKAFDDYLQYPNLSNALDVVLSDIRKMRDKTVAPDESSSIRTEKDKVLITPQVRESQDYKYDVALSFAGEDREYVETVAQELRKLGIRVFYDYFEQTTLWGKDLYTHLQDIYQNQARYTIIFISEHYAKKLWTNHERKMAQARAFTESREYILPARFDDTQIEGIVLTTGYIDLRSYSPQEFSNLIYRKLEIKSANQKPEQQSSVIKPDFEIMPPTAFPGFIKLNVNIFEKSKPNQGALFPIVVGFENLPKPIGYKEFKDVWAHITYRENGFGNMEMERVSSGCWIDEPLPDVSFPVRKPRFLLLGGWYYNDKNPFKNEFRIFEYSRQLHRPIEKPTKFEAPRKFLIDVLLTSNGHHDESCKYNFIVELFSAGSYRSFPL